MLLRRIILFFTAFAFSIPALALDPEKLFEKIAPSVVIVWSLDAYAKKVAQGSGIVIAPGEVVTNCHVIEKASSIQIEQGGQSTKARIRFSDYPRDLCQLTMETQQPIGLQIRGVISYNDLRVGQRVYTVGAPEGLELSLGEGLISQLRGTDSFNLIQTTAPISHGSSGGGLFDAEGRLLGITTFISKEGQNLNFAIPASWIFELPTRHTDRDELARKKIADATRATDAELERRKAADAERAAGEERKRRDAELRRREESDRLAADSRYWAEARRLERLARSKIDSYTPRVSPYINTSFYDVRARNADELYREISNRGPLGKNGTRFATRTRWDVRWKFRHKEISGHCEIAEVAIALDIVHTFPNWVDLKQASPAYVERWQSYLAALKTFHALHQKNGNMAADEIEVKLQSIQASPTCESLERNANNIAQAIIRKYQTQDEELGRNTNYGDTLGARFPR